MSRVLLQVKGLTTKEASNAKKRPITEDVSLSLNQGEILGVVGESGSGKSMTALAILGLLPRGIRADAGEVLYRGRDVLQASEKEKRAIRGRGISIVFQDPMTSLNPVKTVGWQVEEALRVHGAASKGERKERTLAILSEVGLEDVGHLYRQYPHQLSGGMRQRAMIAMALVGNPDVLIADEPTTALDAELQDVILGLIKKMSQKYGIAVLLISHDLKVIGKICERAIVMHEGRVVERGTLGGLLANPQAEYTKRLVEALPSKEKKRISGGVEEKKEKALSVQGLNVYYEEREKGLYGRKRKNHVLQDVSFELYKGETLGLVGRSGIGKSTLAKAITGLLREEGGRVKRYGNRIQMVFQDPYSSLNPAKKVGWILEEPLRIKGGYKKEERARRVREVLANVGLEEEHLKRSVAGLSGGQRQRVAIACAIVCRPDVLILDEPVSALDVTVQDRVLSLLQSVKERYGVSYLLISHDREVLEQMCDRIITL